MHIPALVRNVLVEVVNPSSGETEGDGVMGVKSVGENQDWSPTKTCKTEV